VEQSTSTSCEGCARFEAAIDAVLKWLNVELEGTPKSETHLRGTLRCCIEALGPRNPRLYPPPKGAPAAGDPKPGESFDEQAVLIANRCPVGREEARAVELRRAAVILLDRSHGRPDEYRGDPRGPYRVPLRDPLKEN
jgi:hypothetical protein